MDESLSKSQISGLNLSRFLQEVNDIADYFEAKKMTQNEQAKILQKEIKTLKEQSCKIEEINSQLTQRIGQLTQQNIDLTQHSRNLEQQNQFLLEKNDQLTRTVNKIESELEHLRSLEEKNQAIMRQREKQLHELMAINENLSQRNEQLSAEVIKYKMEPKQSDSSKQESSQHESSSHVAGQMDELRKRLKQAQEKIQVLQKNLQEGKITIRQLKDEIFTLKFKLDNQTGNSNYFMSENSRLNFDNRRFRYEIQTLEQKMKKQQQTHLSHEKEFNQKLRNLENENKQLQNSLMEFYKEKATYHEELEAMKVLLKKAMSEKSQLKMNNSELSTQHNDSKEQIRQLTESVTNLRQLLERKTQQLQKNTIILESTTHQLNKTTNQLQETSQKLSQKEQQLQTYNQQSQANDLVRMNFDALKYQNSQLKMKIFERDEEIIHLKNQLLDNQNAITKNQQETYLKTIKQKDTQINDLKKQLQVRKQYVLANKVLQNKIKKLTEVVRKYEHPISIQQRFELIQKWFEDKQFAMKQKIVFMNWTEQFFLELGMMYVSCDQQCIDAQECVKTQKLKM